MLDHHQWIADTLAHRDGPVPYQFSFTPPARAKLETHYGTAGLEEHLGLPIRMSAPWTIKPLYASPEKFGALAADEFGVQWSTSTIDRGSPHPRLTCDSLDGYRFPDATEASRFIHLAEWSSANASHFRILWAGDLWERATFMRGMEDILLDLSLNPAFVQRLLRGLADHVLETMRILLETCDFECFALSDDYGTQHGLIMSPAQWRSLIRPLLAEIYSLARGHGKVMFHHSCGDNHEIVGDLVDLGLDILHPVQPEAMDLARLKREYGRQLTFCGGIPTQRLLPDGTPAQVRDEVRRLKSEMGRGGGYILEPGITLQADIPTANLVAMIEEARA